MPADLSLLCAPWARRLGVHHPPQLGLTGPTSCWEGSYFHSSPSGLSVTAWMVSIERAWISLWTSSMLLEASTICPHRGGRRKREWLMLFTTFSVQGFQTGLGSRGEQYTSGILHPTPLSDLCPSQGRGNLAYVLGMKLTHTPAAVLIQEKHPILPLIRPSPSPSSCQQACQWGARTPAPTPSCLVGLWFLQRRLGECAPLRPCPDAAQSSRKFCIEANPGFDSSPSGEEDSILTQLAALPLDESMRTSGHFVTQPPEKPLSA